MKGSEFASLYAPKGLASWEAAAFELAKSNGVVSWPWVEVPLTDGQDTAVVRVTSDAFAVGTESDPLRLPLTPRTAQTIANLTGALLPTPWIVYRSWQQADIKLTPTPQAPNKGPSMAQYAAHNAIIQTQVDGRKGMVRGCKKSVVVSNDYKPGKVIIFGWYRPMPDVFDDGAPMGTPGRQPTQPLSNVHSENYLDYSHGIYFCHPKAMVNGKEMDLVTLYQHPTLSRLVSKEPRRPTRPIRVPRYPAPNAPPQGAALHLAGPMFVPTTPGYSDMGLLKVIHDYEVKKRGMG